MRTLSRMFLSLILAIQVGKVAAATFDIGAGDFPRTFVSTADDLTSFIDSTGTIIVGTLFVSGPAIFEFTPALIHLSARKIEMSPGASLTFSGTIELTTTDGITTPNVPAPPLTLPHPPVVQAGSAIFAGGGNGSLQIQNNSAGIINWQAFSVGANTEYFAMGSGGKVVLNTVTTSSPPIIGLLVSSVSSPPIGVTLASPVSEPSTYLLAAAGMLVVIAAVRRAKDSPGI